MRDRLSRSSRGSGDEGRTVLEAVVALGIIAATAAAWVQTTTVAAKTERTGDLFEAATEIASSQIEVMRATPGIEDGTDGAGGSSSYDGLTVVTSGTGPDHDETLTVAGTDFEIARYVLDPGSATRRHLVVEVSWDDQGVTRDVRVDTAIPVVPDAVPVPSVNLLLNGGFEFPNGGGPAAGAYGFFSVNGWLSDRSDGLIETWATGHQGVPSAQGDFHVELNMSAARAVYQTVPVSIGAIYQWSIDHRGRDDDDTMEVLIDGVVVATHTTAPGAWVTYSGVHVATSDTLVLGFRAVDAGALGNLIDNASLTVVGG